MAVDWFLIVIIVVMTIALLIGNVYILVYFQHDDDKNTAYFPKAIVANNSSAIGCKEGWNTACGNINMDVLWLIVFMSIIVIIVVLLPYSMYYYEADDGDDSVGNAQWLETLKMEIATLVVAIALFVVLYVTVSKSHIPMRALEVNSLSPSRGFHAYTDGATLATDEIANAALIPVQGIKVTLDVSFPVYITGLLCIQKQSLELIELGKSIKASMERPGQGTNKLSWERKKQKRLDFVTLNKFKQSVYLLESDMEELKLCHEDYKNYNPLVAVFKLILGCIAAFVSTIWVFHIELYMLPPVPLVPFLNTYFIWFDQWFPLFGTISVGIFSSYLLACAVKGCFKFGMRCFCFALHPMKLHGTYMNSKLFNLGLRSPHVDPTMMGNQIHYLQGMSFFWEYNIFVYAILAFSLLTMTFLVRYSLLSVDSVHIAKPKDNSSPVDEIRKKIERQVRETRSV
ncbi:Lmbr1-like membrane protein, partial [Globisporangium splendens]